MSNHIMKEQMKKDYIFVYSKEKMIYLKKQGFNYLFTALSLDNQVQFWLFKRTLQLDNMLNAYRQKQKLYRS